MSTCSGVDGGSDVDPVLLGAIYERIKASEFAAGEDHVTQVMRVEQMLIGKKPVSRSEETWDWHSAMDLSIRLFYNRNFT